MHLKRYILVSFLGLFLFQCIPIKNPPQPTGGFNVGTQSFELTDTNRLEWFTKDNLEDTRKIMVQVWYPTIDTEGKKENYIDYGKIRAKALAEQFDYKPFIFNSLIKVKSNSFSNAKADNQNGPYPLVIFSHGLGGNRTQNTANIESLVSNGYIVFAIEHTYDANITVFNDSTYIEFDSYLSDDVGREEFYKVRIPQIKTRADDISFVIDQITAFKTQGFYIGKMCDLKNIGVFGHSFGGATVVLSSFLDSRVDACMNLDGWFEPIPKNIINSGINIPFCYIGQEQEKWHGAPYNGELLFDFHNNNKNHSYIIEIKKSKHFDYADIPYLTRFTRLMGLSGKPGKTLTLDLNKTIANFFNLYLKEQENNWYDIIKDNYDIKVSSK